MLYFLECPYHTQSVKSAVVNWTATYRRDSDIVAPYERWQYYNPKVMQIQQNFNYAANKTKKVLHNSLITYNYCHKRNSQRRNINVKVCEHSNYCRLLGSSLIATRAIIACTTPKSFQSTSKWIFMERAVLWDARAHNRKLALICSTPITSFIWRLRTPTVVITLLRSSSSTVSGE